LGTLSAVVYSSLTFSSSAISGVLVDASIAIITAPAAILAIVFAWKSMRWLLLSLWPTRLAIEANPAELILRLGPFGTRHYDADHLTIAYPFEQDDVEEGSFEAFLPEDEQLDRFVPRITHPAAIQPLNRTILEFTTLDERAAAQTLRSMIDTWRSRKSR